MPKKKESQTIKVRIQGEAGSIELEITPQIALEALERVIHLAISDSLPDKEYARAADVMENSSEYDSMSLFVACLVCIRGAAKENNVTFEDFIKYEKKKEGQWTSSKT